MSMGWECPRCHTVMAPWVDKCPCAYKAEPQLQYRYTLCPKCGGAFPSGQSHTCISSSGKGE